MTGDRVRTGPLAILAPEDGADTLVADDGVTRGRPVVATEGVEARPPCALSRFPVVPIPEVSDAEALG